MIVGRANRDIPQATNGPVALRAVHPVPVDTKQRRLPPMVEPPVPPTRASDAPDYWRAQARLRLARITRNRNLRAARASDARKAWLAENEDTRRMHKEQIV